MTPRADIERRVRAAAEGDFVIAFYNPVSLSAAVSLFPWALEESWAAVPAGSDAGRAGPVAGARRTRRW